MAGHLEKTILWENDQIIPLRKHKDYDLNTPTVVRIVAEDNTGQLPRKLTDEPLLLHSIVLHKKVICQSVEFVAKDGQLYFSEQRFSIPLAYVGWFEVLSEDGKAVPPCRTIEQIAGFAPDQFLVRSRVKAYLSEENGEPNYSKTRVVEKGEVVTVIGQLNITHGWRKQKKQILHCLDGEGLDIYFDFKTSGQFSAMAGPTNISGVHSIEGITGRFRLPLTVRVVSGQIPKIASENECPGMLRLVEIQNDTTALFLPLHSNQKLIPVSVRTNFHLKRASNMADVCRSKYYRQLVKFCDTKVEKYYKTMQVLVSTRPKQKTYSAKTLPAKRSKRPHTMLSHTDSNDNVTEEDILFDEVDDLYAYVRRGGVPPRPRPRSWAVAAILDSDEALKEQKSSSQPILSSNGKPRGLLATLTAGKFPTKSSTLLRQHKIASSPTEPTGVKVPELPSGKGSILKAFIEKYRSMDSLAQTEVDPYVDEKHYQNFQTIEKAIKHGAVPHHRSLEENTKPNETDILLRSQSINDLLSTDCKTSAHKFRNLAEPRIKNMTSMTQITKNNNNSNADQKSVLDAFAFFDKPSYSQNRTSKFIGHNTDRLPIWREMHNFQHRVKASS